METRTGLMRLIAIMLGKYAKFQHKHVYVMIAIILAITVVAGIGITKVIVESDFSKFDPKGLPVTELNKKVGKIFSSTSGIVIVVELDDDLETNPVQDIRDPEVMKFLVRLENNLREEGFVENVASAGAIFQQGVPESLDETKAVLSQVPGSENFFSKDYSFTPVFVSANVGTATEQLEAANDKVDEVILLSTPPSGVKTVVTGDPKLGSTLFRFLIQDSTNVLIYASILIFIMLIITQLSVKRAFMIIFPLLFGLSWTLGALGWFDIPITVATAGLSAMLLGLGVEYAIFLNSRYKEERRTKSVDESVELALTNVGTSIFSSGGTTVIGFLALSLSIFPMLSQLGFSLAIGIFMLLSSTLLIAPILITIDENIVSRLYGRKVLEEEEKIERDKVSREPKINKVFGAYGRIVARYPFFVFLFALGITILMFNGMQQIQEEDFDFRTVLPEDMPELQAFILLENEFGDTSDVKVYVQIDPTISDIRTSEILDLRNPEALRYIDMLAQKLRTVEYVIEAESISDLVKQANNGRIPGSITQNREVFDSSAAQRFITRDYSGTLIRITATDEAMGNQREIVRQINEVIEETDKPEGLKVTAIGEIAVVEEQNSIIGPDSSRTSMIALLVIIIFLFILTRSVKNTFLPLATVIVAVIWTLGLIGFLKVPFTSITSSVITMTIGIGIDFGLQLINRFNYELKTSQKRKAMEKTLIGVLTPMIITVIAAVIGFRAMNFGNLSVMADLGTTMSIAIVVSMLGSITGVAALIVMLQRDKRKK